MKLLDARLIMALALAGCSQPEKSPVTAATPIVPEQTQSYALSSFELDDGAALVLPGELPEAYSAAELAALPFSDWSGEAVFIVNDDARVLKSLNLTFIPGPAGSLPRGALDLTWDAPVALGADGMVSGPLTMSAAAASGGLVTTEASLGFSHSSVGVMAINGVYDLEMRMSPVALPVGFAGLNIFFDLTPKATLTEKWPKLDDAMRERLAGLIQRRRYQAALDALKAWLKANKVEIDDDIEFVLRGTGEGIALESNGRIQITFGTGAFASSGKFVSAFLHELKHVRQYQQNPIPPTNQRELEAWLQECENLKQTGLDRDRGQMRKIKHFVRDYYKKVKAARPLPPNIKSLYKRGKACVIRVNKLTNP